VRIGGGLGAHQALAAVRRRVGRAAGKPAFGIAVITPLMLAGAVGAAAPTYSGSHAPVRDAAVTPLAAVAPKPVGPSGPRVVAAKRPPNKFRFGTAIVSAPPPAAVVTSPGALRIPVMALTAYRNAERMMASASPGCGVSWNLLAGIGRIESMHAFGGATDARGTAVRPIYGPALDGTLPGNEIIVQSRAAGRVTYARAIGPMQFLPGTWSRYASDGDRDGKANPQNLFDSTLAAARYLCTGNLDLRDQSHVMAAILRYNNSMPYARNVLAWAAAYATGVVPVDLPPITGPKLPLRNTHIDKLGNPHIDKPVGLGPGLPVNATGRPLIDFSRYDSANQFRTGSPGQVFAPGPGLPPPPGASCEVFCIPQGPLPPPWPAPGAPPPWPPPGAPPPWPAPVAPPPPGAPPPPPGPLAPSGPPPGPAI